MGKKKKSYKNNPEYETIFAMNKTRIYKELLKSMRQNWVKKKKGNSNLH